MSAGKGRRDHIFYINKFGFTLCQQNGQRTYGGPPPDWGSRPPPSRDTEVFIGRLPRMCFEDELIPLFLTAGELYEFRLMLDFSGTNRGYGYAHYATLAGAQRAIETLNKYEIRPGHHIGVLKSKNNCRLLFGNIGSALDAESFNEFIRTTTDQVLNVLMFRSFQQLKQTDFRISSEVEEAFLGRMPRNNGKNQFAIVEYENHKAAAVARRVLIPKYGHILAIDWAVPPRDRKRFGLEIENQIPPFEKPLSKGILKDSSLLLLSKPSSKSRPVPVLLVQPSLFDDVPFMPKFFKSVVKFFKYQLSVCLYKSVDQSEISLFICKEIERKIVDHITNLENCSQAIQLIFNYFSWYNERKRLIINSEIQNLIQEVKIYADSFVLFINKRIKHGPSQNPAEDNYYMSTLPLQLNILFRIILRSDIAFQEKLSSGITKGLNWLVETTQRGDKSWRNFLEEIINVIQNEDDSSLDKASALAKTVFLNTVTSSKQSRFLMNNLTNPPMPNNLFFNNEQNAELEKNIVRFGENEKLTSSNWVPSFFQNILSDLSIEHLKDGASHYIPMPFSQIGKISETVAANSNFYPPVPLLLVQPSIMNKIPFMPKIFNNVIFYFKHLIRICLNVYAWQIGIPQQAYSEIERKIIDRISNMENCSEGVQLILNYFYLWFEKRPYNVNLEIQKILQEVKMYADSFINFVWRKTMSVYVPNEKVENYFCKILPLRLNLLFHIMLIFNSENPMGSFIGIKKGLSWLEYIMEKGSPLAKQFLEELTYFIVELDPSAYERAKPLGKIFLAEMMHGNKQCIGLSTQPITFIDHGEMFSCPMNGEISSRNSPNSVSSAEIQNGFYNTASSSASDSTLD